MKKRSFASLIAGILLGPWSSAFAINGELLPDLTGQVPCLPTFFNGTYVASCISGACGGTLKLVNAEYESSEIESGSSALDRSVAVALGQPFVLAQNGCYSVDVEQGGRRSTVDLNERSCEPSTPGSAECMSDRRIQWTPKDVVAGWLETWESHTFVVYERQPGDRDLKVMVIDRRIRKPGFFEVFPQAHVESSYVATYYLRRLY